MNKFGVNKEIKPIHMWITLCTGYVGYSHLCTGRLIEIYRPFLILSINS